MKAFDFVNSINNDKKDLIRSSENPELAEKLYAPFVINRALSFFPDTIMYSNEMNVNHHLDNKLQNDYFLNSIRSGKRYSKWHKRQESEDVSVIQEYYEINNYRALEISKVLSKEHIDLIKTKIIKGGNNVQSKSVGGS